jgi:hypothetical protein
MVSIGTSDLLSFSYCVKLPRQHRRKNMIARCNHFLAMGLVAEGQRRSNHRFRLEGDDDCGSDEAGCAVAPRLCCDLDPRPASRDGVTNRRGVETDVKATLNVVALHFGAPRSELLGPLECWQARHPVGSYRPAFPCRLVPYSVIMAENPIAAVDEGRIIELCDTLVDHLTGMSARLFGLAGDSELGLSDKAIASRRRKQHDQFDLDVPLAVSWIAELVAAARAWRVSVPFMEAIIGSVRDLGLDPGGDVWSSHADRVNRHRQNVTQIQQDLSRVRAEAVIRDHQPPTTTGGALTSEERGTRPQAAPLDEGEPGAQIVSGTDDPASTVGGGASHPRGDVADSPKDSRRRSYAEKKQRAAGMLLDGKSPAEIARELNVSPGTMSRWREDLRQRASRSPSRAIKRGIVTTGRDGERSIDAVSDENG